MKNALNSHYNNPNLSFQKHVRDSSGGVNLKSELKKNSYDKYGSGPNTLSMHHHNT